MREWYTSAELAGIPGVPSTPSGVIRAARNDSWTARKRDKGKGLEYHLRSLPRATQDYLIGRSASTLPALVASALPVEAPETRALVTTPRAPAPRPTTNAELNDWQRRIRDARLLILTLVDDLTLTLGTVAQAVARVERMAGDGTLPLVYADALAVANARAGGGRTVTRATLYRWLAARAADGPHALAAQRTAERMQPAWVPYLLKLYQDPRKPSVAACWRKLAAEAPAGLALPSLRTAEQWIATRLPAAVTQWGRMGTRARRAIQPFIRRSIEGLWPMDIVAVDGHAFKAWVAHPLSGERFRPELTTYLDIATRRIVSVSAWVAESQYAIWLAYRRMVLHPEIGIPAIQYSDNGAYRAEQHRTLLERIGTTQAHSLPGRPQANGAIERINRSLWVPAAQELPLYAGKNVDKDAFRRAKDRADKTGEGIVPWTDFLGFIDHQVRAYNARPHETLRRGTRRLSPDDAWAEAVAEGWAPTHLEGDDLHDLLPSEQRTCRRGEVRLPWGIYSAADLEPYHGRAVRVSFDPSDGSRVWVATPDGALITIATRDGNARPYQPESALEAAREGRQAARVKRLERRIAQVERDETPIIEGTLSELPYLTLPEPGELVIETPATVVALPQAPESDLTAPVLTPTRTAQTATIAVLPVRRHWIDDLENDAQRYEAITHIKSMIARDERLDDKEMAFFQAFRQTAYYKRTEQMWADFERQTAAVDRPGPRPL